jgi:hypothetical protein
MDWVTYMINPPIISFFAVFAELADDFTDALAVGEEND